MFDYRGPAECVLPDDTVLPVSVSLRADPGLLDGIVGTATGDVLSLLNASEVRLRFPDGRDRMFLVKDAPFTSAAGFSLELVSNGDWLP